MSSVDLALWIIAAAAVLTAIAASRTLHSLRQAEREIAERKAADHPAE